MSRELGQALLRDLYIQFFVLHTKLLDLVGVFHAQQALAHGVGMGLDLSLAEAVRLQRVDHAVDVPEFVIEKRPLHPRWQGRTHVANFLAHGIPGIGHVGAADRVPDLKKNRRLSGLGKAADLVGVGHFLQGALDLVGDLLRHLLGRCAEPHGTHHHGAKGEWRVFVLTELEVGCRAQQQQHDHQVAGQRGMLQRPLREIEARRGLHRVHADLTASQPKLLALQNE